MKKMVFDSHAILKFSQDEEGADKIEKFLLLSQQGKIKSFINQINLGEIYYKTIRRLGLEPAKSYLESFYQLPIQVVSPSSEIIFSASEIKAEYAISYADCFAVATALKHEASIVTGDPEFKRLKNLVKIEWI
jgi:ribonuclease VapC